MPRLPRNNAYRETQHAASLQSGTNQERNGNAANSHSPHLPTSVSHRNNHSLNPPNLPTTKKPSADEQ
ncbi:MAG: hypothetical protein IKN29_03395 [Bacteroidales bacterium]|nr:hypothetical protein [Bacteroidales bacterium]